MKPIILSDEAKTELFAQFIEKFKKEIDNYAFNGTDTTLSFKLNFSKVAQEKVVITYTQEAYLRMQSLVEFFDTEVAWYGLVERLDPTHYYVYDVKVCKQYVNGAKVDTEDEDTLEFFDSLTDDEANHLHFQAHSHVKMSTGASGVDLQNQHDVVKNLGKTGFYIFQIWNKNNDINTYIYDLDNNVYYDRKDVLIDVEGVDDYIAEVADLVVEKKAYPYQYSGSGYNYSSVTSSSTAKQTDKKNESKEEKEKNVYDYEPAYLPGYYDGYYGRWDY